MTKLIWKFAPLALGALMASVSMSKAQGRPNCAPRDVVLQKLASSYGETRQSFGLAANNTAVEVFASVDTGTWTITMTNAQGLTCLVASGEAFENLAHDAPDTSEGT